MLFVDLLMHFEGHPILTDAREHQRFASSAQCQPTV